MSDSEVLVTDVESGRVFTLGDYRDRYFLIEQFLFDLYDKYNLDSSGLFMSDSDSLAEDEDFLWPVFVVDGERDSQGYCDLFVGDAREQALFLFEQLMDAY